MVKKDKKKKPLQEILAPPAFPFQAPPIPPGTGDSNISSQENITPEATTEEQRRRAGQSFIGARERAASLRGLEGRRGQETAAATLVGEGGQVLVGDVQRRKEETIEELEEAGGFEQVEPTRPDLQPIDTGNPFEDLPLIGPAGSAQTNTIAAVFGRPGQGFETPKNMATAREIALAEIREAAFQEGVSAAEAFGATVESVPIIGKFAAKWVGDIIEAPSSNADQVFEDIKSLGEQSTNSQEKTRAGIMTSSHALEVSRQMEEQVAALEGRLKILIQTSARLRSNTDLINKMQTKILDVKIRINNFKTVAQRTLAAELAGERIVAPDELLLTELRNARKK